jgi:hypothetical protein
MRLSSTGNNLPGVAVVGPHRIGKTSLLKQLMDPGVRARYVEQPGTWHIAYLDASRRPWRGFGDFRSIALEALGLSAEQQASHLHDCFSDAVQRIISQLGSKTTILLIDEFNYIAAELGKDEQAELRSAIDNIPSFSLVLGVSQNPDEILEHIPYDTASELAPVINLALPTLARLTESEGRQLVKIGREQAGLKSDSEAENWLLECVGTHPLLLHAACFAWYRVVGTKAFSELSPTERNRAQDNVRTEVEFQWHHVVRSLSGAARNLVLGCIPPANTGERLRAERELEKFGLMPWFRQSGAIRPDELSVSGDKGDPADQLMIAVEEINHRQQLLAQRPEGVFRTDSLFGNDMIYLRRQVRDRESFVPFVQALCRLLYDGSNAVVSPQLRGKLKPVLPGWCYKDLRSVITQVMALRNYSTHLLERDPDIAAEHLRSAGDIFDQYCHKRAPETADFEIVRVGLLTTATRFVRRLNQFLPLSLELKADEFF